MPRKVAVAFTVVGLLLAACAPRSEEAAPAASVAPGTDPCAVQNLNLLEPGTLTIGADRPAFDPWFENNDPSNGKGYEGAFAAAVAEKLGFTPDQVTWVTVPFNKSFAPGDKDFDFYLTQVTNTPDRAEAVDFSDSYYEVSQAIVVKDGSSYQDATGLNDFSNAVFGVEVGTTSLTAIEDVIQPATDPKVYDRTSDAAQALANEQIDAMVLDMPTAFYALPKGVHVVGRVPGTEDFGLVFAKGNPIVPCVNKAIAEVKADGTLDDLAAQYLPPASSVPELT